MSRMNVKCPKCGSEHVQLSQSENKHGIIYLLLFWMIYVWVIFAKWFIGLCVLCFFDWWMAIIKKKQGKPYLWKFRGWFSNRKRFYYCHNCGYNFKA